MGASTINYRYCLIAGCPSGQHKIKTKPVHTCTCPGRQTYNEETKRCEDGSVKSLTGKTTGDAAALGGLITIDHYALVSNYTS